MTLLVRLAELIVFLFLVAWTVVFPLATLVSLVVMLALLSLVGARMTARRVRSGALR